MKSAHHLRMVEACVKFDTFRNDDGIMSYACKQCSFKSKRMQNMQRHISTIHDREEESEDSAIVVESDDRENMLKDFITMQTDMMMNMMKLMTDKMAAPQSLTIQNNSIKQKNFNLNVFLNEECKNAMNLSDFVRNLVVTVEDLDHIGEVGYAEGMTKIITKALNEKAQTKRPVHCSDVKRETIYVKEESGWHKDNDCEETRQAIQQIAKKNYIALREWCKVHPNHMVMDSPEYDEWYSISQKLCNTAESVQSKILHRVAEATIISKD